MLHLEFLNKSHDPSSFLTAGTVKDYATIQETIGKAISLYQSMHNIIGENVQQIEDSSLLGEAYVNACLSWAGTGRVDMIPSNEYVRFELCKLIRRYSLNGITFTDEIMSLCNEFAWIEEKRKKRVY